MQATSETPCTQASPSNKLAGGTDLGVACEDDLQQRSRRYLCFFVHRFLDFRIEEAQALAELAMTEHAHCELTGDELPPSTLEWQLPETGTDLAPFRYVNLPSDAVAQSIASRSMLVKVTACNGASG